MKNKLIELLRAGEREFAKECRKHFDCKECSCFIFGYSPNCLDALTADYLMANGVTISTEARPLKEWHEDIGDVLWWKFPIEEPPYVGSPLDLNWPSYHTHWTPIVAPEPPKEGR